MIEVKHERATLTLYEGCLNDDHVVILEDGFKFTGHNGSTVALVYYTYANEWSNHENIRFFTTLENAMKWYKKEFRDRAVYQGRVWLTEGGDEEYEKKDEDGIVVVDDEEALNEFDNFTLYCEY